MFDIGVDGNAIYNALVYKALSIASIREIGDSSLKNVYNTTFNTVVNSNSSKKSYFVNNIGVMSDGLSVPFENANSSSYNVLTSIVLQKDSKNYSEKWVSHNRFGNNLDSVFIYINGIKIPDSQIFMYITDSHTNFIIAKKYFIDGDNDIIIEKRKFKNFEYGGVYDPNFNSDVKVFSVSDHRNLVVNEHSTLVFLNGIYIPYRPNGDFSFVSYLNGVVAVKFEKILTGCLEVFIDSTSLFSSTNRLSGSSLIVPFFISDSFTNPIHGPINKDNCSFFLNGKRINNNQITQKSRLHFVYNHYINSEDTFSIIYSDLGIIDMHEYKLYADDYFLYNFIGSEGVTNKIIGPANGPITTHPLDISNVVYNDVLYSNEYSYSEVVNINNILSEILDPSLRIQQLLKYCPYLLKDFLEMFTTDIVNKKVEYNGEPEVVVGVSKEYDVGTKVIRLIIVNGKIAKIDEFVVSSLKYSYDDPTIEQENLPYWRSVVNGSWFTNGENDVQIIDSISNSSHQSYKVVNIDRYQTVYSDYDYRAVTDVFGSIKDIDDFDMLAITKRESDPDGIYMNSEAKYGFKRVRLPKLIMGGKIYISFGPNDPHIDMFIIMSNRQHKHQVIEVDGTDLSYSSLFHPVYCGTETFYDNGEYHTVNIPAIHYGSIILANQTSGVRLFRGIDFSFKSMGNNPNMRTSGIILQKSYENGTKIDVVLTPEYTSSDKYISMSEQDSGPNKYALLYLNELKFPFSTKYVKIFANNKNINESDIDILSNKLIRLHSIETICPDETINPAIGGHLFNVFIEFAFRISFTKLDPFITSFGNGVTIDSVFEQEVAKIFAPFMVSKPKEIQNALVDVAALNRVNSIYESLNYYVDSNNKTPNTIVPGSYYFDMYNIYIDAYLRWFISDESDHIFKSFENIPEHVLRELEIFILDYNGDNRDVVIRPNIQNLISDIEISSKYENYPGYTVSGTIKTFLECCVENNLSVQECFARYNEFKQSNMVYKQDLLPISALETFEGEDIIIGRTTTFKSE